MVQAIDIRRADLSRAGLELRDLADAWRRQPQGDRFTEALLSYLNSHIKNANTRRSYGFALTEFWLWYQATHRTLPTPDKVRRSDAHAYAEYLGTRTQGLDAERLAIDPERTLDLSIYNFVRAHPGTRIDNIRRHLLQDRRFTTEVHFTVSGRARTLTVLSIEKDEVRGDALDDYMSIEGQPPANALDLRLSCLTERNLFRRSPTIAEIRRGDVDLGEGLDPRRAQIDYRVPPEIFSYTIDTHLPDGTARITTVAHRLTALSSFWEFLLDTGENNDKQAPLLQHNIWSSPLKDVGRRVPARKQVARERTTPSLELIGRVLATAYVKSHGPEQAFEAAMTAADGGEVSAAAIADPSVYDLRDRAVILFTLLVGARADEIARIRRRDLQAGDPAIVELQGKGDKPRLVGVPPPVMAAIEALFERIETLAESAEPLARIHLLLGMGAPLFPVLKLWGRNESPGDEESDVRGLSPRGYQMMLRRRAFEAGIEPGSADLERIHPHGIRHRAALLAVERGRGLPAIQATLGHTSLATTGQYVEERDPRKRLLIDVPARGHRMPSAIRTVIEAPPPPQEEDLDEYEVDDDIVDEDLPIDDEDEVIETETPASAPGLVAIGDAPLQPMLEPSSREILLSESSHAVRYLLGVYGDNWGEENKRARTKLDPQGKEILSHVYVGKRSGLGWWQGSKGELKDPDFSYAPNPAFPAMPVISPGQFLGGSGDAACDGPLCLGLSALWQRWFDDEEYGPTASQALVRWIRASARVTVDVDDVIRKRRGEWIAFDAPLDETKLGKAAPSVLREHLDSAVLAWFERSAWQFRPREASAEPIGAALTVPDWYAQADPLATIPERDRAELYDWLQVLTGLPPKDRSPTIDGYSRKELGDVMSAVCQYEMIAGDDDLGFGFGMPKKDQKQMLGVLNEQIKLAVAKASKSRVTNFDYQKRRVERKVDKTRQTMAREAAQRSESEDEQQETLRTMYSKYLAPYIMALLGELFGPAAEADPLLGLFSLCSAGAPLRRAGDKYKELFRLQGRSIEHTSEFAREFARETGAHSECVARRLARHIYEESRAPGWAERRNWPEVIEYLDAMSAYQVPCPREQEHELRTRLGTQKTIPVFDAWLDAERRIRAGAVPESEDEIEEVMREEEERSIARATRAPVAFEHNPHRLTGSAASFIPNAALLAIWAVAIRPRWAERRR